MKGHYTSLRRIVRRMRYTAVALRFMRENRIPIWSNLAGNILTAQLNRCTMFDVSCERDGIPKMVAESYDLGRADLISVQAAKSTREMSPIDYINSRLRTSEQRLTYANCLSPDDVMKDLIKWRVDEVPVVIIREKTFRQTTIWALWLGDNMCGNWFNFSSKHTEFDREMFRLRLDHPSWCILSSSVRQSETAQRIVVCPSKHGIYGYLHKYFDADKLSIDLVIEPDDVKNMSAAIRTKMRNMLDVVGAELLFSQEWRAKSGGFNAHYSEKYVLRRPSPTEESAK